MIINSLIDSFALRQDGSKPLTADWDAGPYKLTARQLASDVAIGTAPLVITSTTLVTNLNADLWDGYQFADYLDQAVKTTSSPTFVTGTFTDIIVDTNLIKTVNATNRIGFNVTAPSCHFDFLGTLLLTGPTGIGDAPTAFTFIGGMGAEASNGGPGSIRAGGGGTGNEEDPGGTGGILTLGGGEEGADGGGGIGTAGYVNVVTDMRFPAGARLVSSDFLVPSGSKILLTAATDSDIAIGSYGTVYYYLEGQTADKPLIQSFFTKSGDGGDSNYSIFYAMGSTATPDDREYLIAGYINTGEYRFQSGAAGIGDVHPIKIYTGANTDQFTLLATGNNTMAGSLMVGAATEAVTKLTIEGALTLKEQAAADGDTAAYGQLWVKTVTPNQLWFTNDAGNDSELSLVAYGEIFALGVADTITITAALQANKVQITSFDTDGASINSTPDHTNDHITITKAGFYLCAVSLHIESAAGGAADTFGFSIYKNDGATEFANCHAHRRLAGGGGDVGSVSISGIIDLAVNDTIELWCWNEDSADDLVVQDVTLSLVWIGST